MATQQEVRPNTDQREKVGELLETIISKHVIHSLGRPSNLHRVQVRPLWNGHFRVNILVGADAASVKVVHSYFLVAHSNGNIIASTPKIKKLY